MTKTEELYGSLIADLMMGFEALKEDYINIVSELTGTPKEKVRERLNKSFPDIKERVEAKLKNRWDEMKDS